MDGGPNYPKTRESYRARGTEADWRYGIECPLALPHSPIISWRYWRALALVLPHNHVNSLAWYWMPSGTTTLSHYQLDLVLNALWHYHTVPLSVGFGIECPLALPHSPVIIWRYWSALWYYHTILLITWLGIQCPLALPTPSYQQLASFSPNNFVLKIWL